MKDNIIEEIKTLQQCKDEVAKLNRFNDWEDVVLQFQAKNYVDQVAELYAAQFKPSEVKNGIEKIMSDTETFGGKKGQLESAQFKPVPVNTPEVDKPDFDRIARLKFDTEHSRPDDGNEMRAYREGLSDGYELCRKDRSIGLLKQSLNQIRKSVMLR